MRQPKPEQFQFPWMKPVDTVNHSLWDTNREARQKQTLLRLREAFKEGERALIGWQQILPWLTEHGFRGRGGVPVTKQIVLGWRRRLGCPVLAGCRALPRRMKASKPFTSNYLLLAWALSLFRSGGFELPFISAENPPKAPNNPDKIQYSTRDTPPPLSPAANLREGTVQGGGGRERGEQVAPSPPIALPARSRIRSVAQPLYKFGNS
jgi:hypothetical protein